MNLPRTYQNQTILFAALDWGYGHLTRSIPIIRFLLTNNRIIFCGTQNQIHFILNEFPQIETELIQGYDIQLSSAQSTYVQIVKQSRKFIHAIKKEHYQLRDLCQKYAVDLIISDNRYGFRHPSIHSIIMTHQVQLKVPTFKKSVNRLVLKYINRFSECWIPDDIHINLSGELSRTHLLKIPHHFIGILSRFHSDKTKQINYKYTAIISGPYPENELFLWQIKELFEAYPHLQLAIVSPIDLKMDESHIHLFYNPSSSELNDILNESDTVISRSGYTTIMELFSLNKKGILIPTKGQYEQEYLAKHLQSKHAFKFKKNTKNLFLD